MLAVTGVRAGVPRWFVLAIAIGGVNCGSPPPSTSEPELIALQVVCSPEPGLLACRARASLEIGGSLAAEPVDVTHQASWMTSDASVATVDHGQVLAASPGIAEIRVSLPSRRGSESTAVSVLVKDGFPPQLAYTREGELRDINSVEIGGAVVALIDENGNARAAVTGVAGSFRFFPVVAGSYRLNGEKAGFRANENLAMGRSRR